MRRLLQQLTRAFINSVVAGQLVPRSARRLALRAWGVDIHTSLVHPRCEFSTPNVTLGRDSILAWGVVLEAAERITLGDRAGLGAGTRVITTTHEIAGPDRRHGAMITRPVVIGAGTWVGAGCLIQPGVTIGEGCIIGAGAVVTKDCDPNGFYAGVPARRIRDLPV